MAGKKYYWLKLNENFFEDDTIQWLEEQENGKDYVLFYLKLCLKSICNEGYLVRYVGEKLIPYDVKALSRLTNTPADTVAVAMKVFIEIGLISQLDSGEIYMNQINEMIGSETRQASIMRRKRAKVNQIKELAEIEENHIPYIEDYTNRSRYRGNYYNVFNRDEQQCVSCGSKSNLCVHHIIDFDETDNKTTQMGSMITLCRSCHSKEHANPRSIVSDEILGKIGFDFSLYKRIDSLIDTHGRSNNVTESYPDVKKSYTEIEKEIEKEIDIDKEVEEEGNTTATSLTKENINLIIETWNGLGLQQLRSINSSTKRHTMLKARIKEYSFEEIVQAIESIEDSTFLKGQNQRGWTITFDWFIKPNNFIKVLEGNYIDKKEKSKQPKTSNPFLEMMQDELAKQGGNPYE